METPRTDEIQRRKIRHFVKFFKCKMFLEYLRNVTVSDVSVGFGCLKIFPIVMDRVMVKCYSFTFGIVTYTQIKYRVHRKSLTQRILVEGFINRQKKKQLLMNRYSLDFISHCYKISENTQAPRESIHIILVQIFRMCRKKCKKVILLSHNLQFEYADKLIQQKINQKYTKRHGIQRSAPKYVTEDPVTPCINTRVCC